MSGWSKATEEAPPFVVEVTLCNHFIMPMPVAISASRVADLLCGAFEGGSTYWAIEMARTGDATGLEFPRIELAPSRRGTVTLGDDEDEALTGTLSAESIQTGLALLARQHPERMLEFLQEDDDATTSDMFLQLCLFGEVIFG